VRVTLLGGTGFIGHHLANSLLEAGADVSVIHRGTTPTRVPGLRCLTADRRDTAMLRNALAIAAPSVLIDMTAYRAGDIIGLLPALPPSLERLVVISSGDVYWTYGAFLGLTSGLAPTVALGEEGPLRDRLYPYRDRAEGPDDLLFEYDKILVEQAALAGAAAPVTILRLPMVYGPGDRQRRVGIYLHRFRADPSTLRINAAEAGWRCTRGYVEDVAWAIRLAALDPRASGRTFNLGEADALTQLEWVGAIAAAAQWPGAVLADVSEPPSMPANWQIPLVTETGCIRRVLGYEEPIGRKEGLRRSVAVASVEPTLHKGET
jgi:nucleoside-diphosphate-sugar epimerase